jgi:hypothetical protein
MPTNRQEVSKKSNLMTQNKSRRAFMPTNRQEVSKKSNLMTLIKISEYTSCYKIDPTEATLKRFTMEDCKIFSKNFQVATITIHPTKLPRADLKI